MHSVRTVVDPVVPFHDHALVEIEAPLGKLFYKGIVAAGVYEMNPINKLAKAIQQHIAGAKRALAVIDDPDVPVSAGSPT
jgi:hypothetical protein